MPTYINLINFTDHGVGNWRASIDRARDYAAHIAQAGGQVREQLWTMGAYDIVVVFDARDDETAARLSMQASSAGNIRTTTMRGFSSDDMSRMILESGG